MFTLLYRGIFASSLSWISYPGLYVGGNQRNLVKWALFVLYHSSWLRRKNRPLPLPASWVLSCRPRPLAMNSMKNIILIGKSQRSLLGETGLNCPWCIDPWAHRVKVLDWFVSNRIFGRHPCDNYPGEDCRQYPGAKRPYRSFDVEG